MEERTLGGRIALAREARGWSASQLATRMGISTQTVKKWEADRSEPRANTLATLSGILAVPLVWLLAESEKGVPGGTVVHVEETATLDQKVEQLVSLHERASILLFEVQTEIRRLQREIDHAFEDDADAM